MASDPVPQLVRTYIKFADNRVARDKSLRVVQYAFKIITWRLSEIGDKEGAKQYKAWASILSMHRKLFRIGMWLDEAVKVSDAIRKLQKSKGSPDKAVVLGGIKSVFGFAYYWMDMLQWLHHAKMRISPDKAALGELRNKLWVGRILFGLAALYFKWQAHMEKERKATEPEEKAKLLIARGKLQRNIAKGCLDIWSPASSLGWEQGITNKGFVGTCGFVSSLIGAYEVWPATK